MKIGNSFSKVLTYSMIMAGGLSSCTRKPLTKMSSEVVANEVKTELANCRKEAAETLKDTTYVLYGRDTLLFNQEFKQNLQHKAKKKVEDVVVGQKMENQIFFSNNKMHIIPYMKQIKEPKYIDTKGLVTDTTLFTTDATNVYVPVEYYGKPNPNAVKNSKK